MKAALLDTHALAWTLQGDRRIPSDVVGMIDAVDMVIVSAVSLYEIGQKLRAGKWPEMEPYRHELIPAVARMGGQVAVVDGQVAEIAATLDWPHRDPFDRIIAATSILTGHRLISADPAFSTLKDARFVPTFW